MDSREEKMKKFKIRFVQEEDLPAIREIYGEYINTSVTFEYALPSPEEFEARVKEIVREYPYLVWEEEGKILGYAYAHRHMSRAAYGWNAELSIYFSGTARSRGRGKIIYEKLMEVLKLQNVRNVYGCVTVPNPDSQRLHGKMGFQLLGIFPKTGYKAGKWHDIAWYGKEIGEKQRPKAFIPVGKIEREMLEKILKEGDTA